MIDGCPAGLTLHENEINEALARRAPGKSPYTSPRNENDHVEILSGVFEGQTTGAPISLLIPNQDADSSKYEPMKEVLRPGHANYTYLQKYGVFDYRGGGRASARETACRVAAGAIARKLLDHYGIHVIAYVKQIASIEASVEREDLETLKQFTYQSPIYCPDAEASSSMRLMLEKTKNEGDSLGGIVEFAAFGVPTGLGEPIYLKLEAMLANAMMGLPATKGFEIGSGFGAALKKGSEHNDLFTSELGQVKTVTNHAGGVLGGISTGMPIVGRVAFKSPSSIKVSQETLTLEGAPISLNLPEGSRHDPCVVIRAVPVVEAMANLVLADALLMHRCASL